MPADPVGIGQVGSGNPNLGLKAWSPKRYALLHMPDAADALSGVQSNAGDAGMFDIFGQGLRAIRQSVVRPDRPALRGALRSVAHLVTVEEVS